MRRHLWVLAVALIFVVSSLAGQEESMLKDDEANLLVNGSFEEGPFVNRFKPLDVGSAAIEGWVVTRGQIDLVGPDHWTSFDGQRSLDLHGSPGFGGIKQTFRTVAGQRYRVTFSMSGSPGSKSSVNSLCVRAAGKKEVFSFDNTGKTLADMGWVTKSWEFLATKRETTLEFHTLDDEDDRAGPALDNVCVTLASSSAGGKSQHSIGNQIANAPDLIISGLSARYINSDRVEYEWTITNIGNADAKLNGSTDSKNVSVQAYVSKDTIFRNADDKPAGGIVLGLSALDTLAPGASKKGHFGCTVKWDKRDYPYLILKVDWGNVIEELNKENNFAAVGIALPADE